MNTIMRRLGIAVVFICIADSQCTSLSVPQASGNRPAGSAGAQPSPRGWQAALAAERGRRQAAAAHLGGGKVQTAAQVRAVDDEEDAEPLHQAAAEPPQPSASQHLAGAVLASFAAGAAVGYWFGRLGALRQPQSPDSKPELAGQHAHAPDSEAVWQREHALAKEELQISSRAMSAALEAEALKHPEKEMKPAVAADKSRCKASSQAGPNTEALSAASAVEAATGQEQAWLLSKEEKAAAGDALHGARAEEEAGSASPGATPQEGSAAEGVPQGASATEGAGQHMPSAVPAAEALGPPPRHANGRVDPGDTDGAPEARSSHAAVPDGRAAEQGGRNDDMAVCSTSGRGEGSLGMDAGQRSLMPWPWAAARAGVVGQAEQALEVEQWGGAAAFWEAFTRELKVRALRHSLHCGSCDMSPTRSICILSLKRQTAAGPKLCTIGLAGMSAWVLPMSSL